MGAIASGLVDDPGDPNDLLNGASARQATVGQSGTFDLRFSGGVPDGGFAEMHFLIELGSTTVSVELHGFAKQGATAPEDVCEFSGVATVAD